MSYLEKAEGSITFGNEESVKLLHHTGLHDGVNKSNFLGQLFRSERVLDGDVLLVIVEQGLGGSESWLGKVGDRVTDNQSRIVCIVFNKTACPSM